MEYGLELRAGRVFADLWDIEGSSLPGLLAGSNRPNSHHECHTGDSGIDQCNECATILGGAEECQLR